MKKYISKFAAGLLSCLIAVGMFFTDGSVFAIEDPGVFTGIEFSTVDMRYDDSVTEADYLSGNGSTMGMSIWGDYLAVAAHFTAPTDPKDANKIFIYDISGVKPVYVTEYDMEDMGVSDRTVSHKIISGVCITDEYMMVTFHLNVGWPKKYISDTLYIYENPLNAVSPIKTLTRVKADDTEIYQGMISTIITDNQIIDLLSSGSINMNVLGSYIITFDQQHNINDNTHFSITDISGETPAVTFFNDYDIFTTKSGVHSARFCNVAFDGNYAYVLTALEGENENGTVNFAVFTIDFTDPMRPEAIGECIFDSNCKYSTISSLGGYLTVEDGYAYVSSCGGNSGKKVYIDGNVHLATLKLAYGDCEFIRDFTITADMSQSKGIGAIGVIEDIAVCLNGPAAGGNSVTYLQFSEEKDEIISYEDGGKINNDSSANCVDCVRSGARMFFGLSKTGAAGGTDVNKAVFDYFRIIDKDIVWTDDEPKENLAYDNISAEFEEPYVNAGINTIHITGVNGGSEKNMQVVLALYDEYGKLVTTHTGDKISVMANESIDIQESIDLRDVSGASGGVLKAYLWEGTDTIRPVAKTASPSKTAFQFTIDEGASTSAGVYDSNDRLVRTLWSCVYYDKGTYTESWDGKDDQGVLVPDGDYRVTIVSSNVEYDTFVDVIGNTSDCSTWDTYVGSYCSIFDMGYDPRTERLYYCSNHVEGGYGLRYMKSNNINKTEKLMNGFYANMTATRVAVDRERIYWGSEEMTFSGNKSDHLSKTFIYATDDRARPYTFDYGEHVASKWNDANNCILYPSALNINVINKWSEDGVFQYNRISGLEVQQNGNFLFSSYLDMNKVYVNNKNTGELLYTLEINAPGAIAITGDNEDILYVAYRGENGYRVALYNVTESGTLEKIREMDSDFGTVLGLAISPSGKKIVVIEGENTNRFQVIDAETEEVLSSFGSGESYLTDTLVKDDKLTFADEVWSYPDLYEHTFAEFVSEDEFLFGDSGNTRIYKMDISGETPQIVDKNLFRGCNYNCQAVLNDETRITAGSMEYEVDYRKMDEYAQRKGEVTTAAELNLSTTNIKNNFTDLNFLGDYQSYSTNFSDVASYMNNNRRDRFFEESWSLKRNYRPYLSKYFPEIDADAIEGVFQDAVTLSNGYTYFRMKHTDGNFYLYKEKDGIISATGIQMNKMDILADGSVYQSVNGKTDDVFNKKDLLGFDEENNPIWGEFYTVVSITPGEHEPRDASSYNQVAITDSDKFIILQASGPGLDSLDAPGKNMHLGAVDISSGYGESYQWTASPRTLRRYNAAFPTDGYFSILAPSYTTRNPLTVGNNIIFCWHGNCFANIFYHFLDNGLPVGVYGTAFYVHGGKYNGKSGAIERALPCNSFSLSVVQNPYDSDSAYIFQPSEGAAGGIFATRVSGLDSISMQDIPIKRSTGLTQGILYTVYDNDEINSAGVIKRGITNTFDIPYIKANDGRSVKYEGYLVPSETKEYKIGTQTDGKVKLYIENSLVLRGNGSNVCILELEEGKMYPFILEVMPNNGNLTYINVGYEENDKFNYITEDMVLCEHPGSIDTNEVNLLEGFFYGENFASGIYGWDAASYGNVTSFAVSTNTWNYHPEDDTDLFISFTVDGTPAGERHEAVVDRNLGEIESDSWKIDMDIRFWGYINRGYMGRGSSGMIIEVLDADEKVIANFYFGGGATNDNDYRAFINDEVVLSYPKLQLFGQSLVSVEQITKNMDLPFNLPQTLTFTAQSDGKIIGEYYGNVIETDIVDPTADWQSPAKVRFSRFNDLGRWSPDGINLGITRFILIKDTGK